MLIFTTKKFKILIMDEEKNLEIVQSNVYTLIYKVSKKKQTEEFEIFKGQLDKYCKYSNLIIYKSSYDLRKDYNGYISVEDNENDFYYYHFNFSSRQKLKHNVDLNVIISPKYYIFKYNNSYLIHPYLLQKQIFNTDFLTSSFAREKVKKIGTYTNVDQGNLNKNIDLEEHFYNLFNLTSLEELREYFYENNLVYYADLFLAKINAINYLGLDITKQTSLNIDLKNNPLYLKQFINSENSTDINIKIPEINKDSSDISVDSIKNLILNNDFSNEKVSFYVFSKKALDNDFNLKELVKNILEQQPLEKLNDALRFLASYYKFIKIPYRVNSANLMLNKPYNYMCEELREIYKKFKK